MADDCIFCKIVQGEIPCARVFEDEQVLAFLDINPISEGHTLIIPKEHFPRVEECSSAALSALAGRLPVLVQAMIKAVGVAGCNIVNNNGRCAGQLVDHVHFHIIPRREGDGAVHFGRQGPYPDGRMNDVAEQIRKELS